MLGFQNIKTFLIKNTPNIGEKKFLLLVKLKVQFRGHTISDLNDEPIVRSFSEKELQKTNQKEFRTEKVIKQYVINCMSNGKDMIIHLVVGLIKKTYESILS